MLTGKSGSVYTRTPDGRVFRDRRIKYHQFPSQRQFHNCGAKCKGFSGPIGSGKSKALVHEAIKRAYLNPGCQGLIAGPTYRMLADSTARELLASLEEHQITHKRLKQNDSVYLPEPKSTVLLRSMDDPERMRAMTLAWFGVDELTYCKEASWTRLCGRLRDPQAPHKCAFAVWTPKGRDWVWRSFISARKVAHYECVRARPFENRAVLAVTPDYYDNLKGTYTEKVYQQEVLGEYVDMFSGAVYQAFDGQNVQPCDFNPALPLIWCQDFNINPMAAVICQTETHGGYSTVYVLREIVLPHSHAAAAAQEFIRRVQPWAEALGRPLDVEVYGDTTASSGHAATGDSCWSIIRKYIGASQDVVRCRYLYGRKNPEHQDRANAVNAMLCSYGDGHRRAGARHLLIDPSCTQLIQDFEEVRWKVDAHGNTYPQIDKTDPNRTHVSDALGYYIHEQHGFRGRFGAVRESLVV